MKILSENFIWDSLRIVIALIFLWAFFDKLLGLGFSTPPDKAWLLGSSPTAGFLANAPSGPLAPLFNSLAGSPVIDVLFMAGLGLTGFALLMGIGLTIATWSGVALMMLIYLSLFPGENNPLLDEHIVYSLVLVGLFIRKEKQFFGYAKEWQSFYLVKKYPILV